MTNNKTTKDFQNCEVDKATGVVYEKEDWQKEFNEKFPENKYHFRDEYNRAARFSKKDRENIKRFISSLLSAQRHEIIEMCERMEKRLDVGDFGADSITLQKNRKPEIWTQDKRIIFNQALQEIINNLKK